MSNRPILPEKKPLNQGKDLAKGFLLLEIAVALGIMILFCTIVARYQRITWFLQRECHTRIIALERSIESHERGAL